MQKAPTVSGTTNLLDILDRVLDKGLRIAGDIRISLANLELLSTRIRLLVCSVDKAEQIGLNWWKYDPNLTASLPHSSGRRVHLPAPPPGQAKTRSKQAARSKRAK